MAGPDGSVEGVGLCTGELGISRRKWVSLLKVLRCTMFWVKLKENHEMGTKCTTDAGPKFHIEGQMRAHMANPTNQETSTKGLQDLSKAPKGLGTK